MNCKILNAEGDRYPQEAIDILKSIGAVDSKIITRDEILKVIKPYDILIVGLGIKVDNELIRLGNNLKIIATATTGIDHIDVDYAKKKEIEVISLKGEKSFLSNITSTAEFTFGLILSLIRRIPWGVNEVKNYNWNRDLCYGIQLNNKILGIIGFGRLGKLVSKYANGFNMRVLAYDPNVHAEEIISYGVEPVKLEKLLFESDIISLHASLDEKNWKMIGQNEFNMMKFDSYFINTARGQLVDEESLLKALENKKIAGAATDVLLDENNFHNNFFPHPLVEYSKKNENLIITPHIAGMAYDAVSNTRIFIAQKIFDLWKSYQ